MTPSRLKRIFTFGRDEPSPEAEAVAQAAWALRVSEYDLFALAYRRWQGREPEPAWLESIFADYMFHQSVPGWVGRFCDEVLLARRRGRLDRAAFGAGDLPRREPPYDYPARFIALTMVVMLLAYLAWQGLF